jgi:GGDEF domain-containing protein
LHYYLLGFIKFLLALLLRLCVRGTDEQVCLQDAATIAEKIRAVLATPYQLGAHRYYSSPSIGICIFCDHGLLIDELIKRADMAMYQAKALGRN